MNIAFFITSKKDVAFLYDDFTLRQGLEKMKYHKYTAIPVIARDGKYVGTVSEGDFLWYLYDKQLIKNETNEKRISKTPLKEIIKTNKYSPVSITASIDELISTALNQNFVPVVDDYGSFIGIVSRKEIIKYFNDKSKK